MTYEQYYKKAVNRYIHKDYQKSLDLFQKARSLDETNDCLNYIGCCYLELNDFDSAIEIFEKIIKISPEWERPIFNLGRIYLQLGNNDKALKYFEAALVLNPDEEDTYYYLGVYYFGIGNYIKAQEFYKKSLLLNDEQPETHLNLGMCYFRLKKYEKSIEEFDIVYKYDSKCLDAIYNKGLALISLEKYRDALDILLDVCNRLSNDLEIMIDIAHCYYKLKDLDSSNVWVDKVLAIEPQHNLANKLLKRLVYLRNNELVT